MSSIPTASCLTCRRAAFARVTASLLPFDLRPLAMPTSALTCRPARPEEIDAVSALAVRVFADDCATDHAPDGVAEYGRFASAGAMRARDARVIVAERTGAATPDGAASDGATTRLVGMLEVRGGTHVAMLFVDRAWQRRGVGRALLVAAFGETTAWPALTVNSTPGAVGAYERLGFRTTDTVQEQKGIRFVPMARAGSAPAQGGGDGTA